MNLTTINNQYVYNLPIDFVPPELEQRYMALLGAKRKLYNSVVDYLNSTIQSISYPGINFPITDNNQVVKRKIIKHKTVGNIYDLYDGTITVTFLNVDSNINYIIMQEVLVYHYLNTSKSFDEPLIVTMVDENRNALYHFQYRGVIWTGISDNTFAYNDQTLQTKNFTATFVYNFIDSEFIGGHIDTITQNSY